MNQLSITLVQSNTGSIIIIISLLLVAGIIGFFTAWLYSKSIYTPIVKTLEDDKQALQKEISDLKATAIKLNNEIDQLKTEKLSLNTQVSDLKSAAVKLNNNITKLKDKVVTLEDKIAKSKK